MPLSVEEITERARTGSLRLQAGEFTDPAVRSAFSTYLGSSELNFSDAEFTAESMTVRGHCAVPALGPEPCPAVAEFLADTSGRTVVGFVLVVDAPKWRLSEPFPAYDLSPLQALGAQSPVVVLDATPRTGKEAETDKEAEQERTPVVPGARWELPGLDEPVLFLASVHEGAFTVSARFPDGLTLPSLRYVADLPGCTGADAVADHFPVEWQGLLASALPALREVTVSYAPGDGRVTGEIEVGLADEWPLPTGVTLSQVRARIALDSAARQNGWGGLSVELSGHLSVAGLECAITVDLPALTAHGELADGSGLFEHAAPGLGKNGWGRLSFLCDLREGAFVVAGELLSPLEIAGVRIEDQAVLVSGGGDRSLEVTLAGTLVVGGTRIGVKATRSAQGWGLTVEADRIAFRDISAWTEQAMGSGLPASLAELTLRELCFEVVPTPSGRLFAAAGSAEFPLPAGLRARAHLTTRISTGDGPSDVEATGSLLLSGPESSLMELDLVADKDPDATSWTATWAAEEGITLGEALAPLLPAPGSPAAGLPNLLPAVEKISLRYTAPTAAGAAASLVLTTDTQQARAVLVVTD
ncbi:hypothetical protein IPZ58_32540 [Streptomyces roseoverticillatus]|uniref:hypothetical protein n=1 Tax=Streptomyces roseoverticillatus TaxID=66429 RepID=UPI001F3036D4|nr:hypothetical protein [Streptomyces roseoverticillatus]MCF3106266.1 hypothetical protein [Streptomyces roseoverticillatus]